LRSEIVHALAFAAIGPFREARLFEVLARRALQGPLRRRVDEQDLRLVESVRGHEMTCEVTGRVKYSR
jgi:hypothetical protein